MTKIPVILLNYNSSDDCRKCVGFLERQRNVDLEIIIVDNASSPDDAKSVEALCREKGLTFIPAETNRGYNAGNNIGLRYAASRNYRYALIANPDMEFPDQDYMSRLADELEAHTDAVVVGSDIVTPEGIHQNPKFRGNEHWKNSFNWLGNLLKRNTRAGISGDVPEWVEDPGKSHYCRCLNGCCFLIKIDFLKEIEFFDERTFLYGEEPILGRQVELAGDRMYYYAGVSCVHAHKKSKEGSSAFCSKHWQNSQLLYIRHYSKQPFYGRWLSELSCRIYFILLNTKHSYSKIISYLRG